jgi:predicted nucleic acid-binding protein
MPCWRILASNQDAVVRMTPQVLGPCALNMKKKKGNREPIASDRIKPHRPKNHRLIHLTNALVKNLTRRASSDSVAAQLSPPPDLASTGSAQ